MDSNSPTLTRQICGLIALLLAIGGVSASNYNIGVGRADTTGPSAEIIFMGYARMKQSGQGVHLRTFSRAFIIDDGRERFVFVSVDSAMVSHDVRAAVIHRLQGKFGDIYNIKNVMISATHSHSTPGGYMMELLFDITSLGFVRQSFEALASGITKSIINAHNSMTPGTIYQIRGEVLDANINRSPQAYINNPEIERKRYKYDVDKDLVQLQFIGSSGKPLGVINWYAVHPTSMNNTNRLISSDNVGYASVLFEKKINHVSMAGKGDFVAAFASTNLGDVSPNTKGPKCEFSGENCSADYTCKGKDERCFASGPGRNMFESTKIIATKIFDEALRLWNSGKAKQVNGPVATVHRFVDMPKQTANFYNTTTGKVEQVHGCSPAMGYSFAAGTTDGPGSFSFKQGTTHTNPMWDLVSKFIAAPTAEDVKCQAPKPILLATGRMRYPYQWQPSIVSTHLAQIGDFMIVGVPGEFTTMSGRRLREAIKHTVQVENNSLNNPTVVVAGLCNIYSDYVTTPEEYQIQRYEGASTIYGPHTLTIYLQRYSDLARLIGKEDATSRFLLQDPQPPDMSKERLISLVTPVIYDSPEWGKEYGDCVKQPPSIVGPGDTITTRFVSGHPRNNLMTGKSYLIVERLEDDESWTPVATDADWETKFIWKRSSVILGSSEVIIVWEIPRDVQPGEYRIRHNGFYRYIMGQEYPYQGVSNHFQVRYHQSAHLELA